MVSFEKSRGRTRSRHGAPQLIPDARQDAKERPGWLGNPIEKCWKTGGFNGKFRWKNMGISGGLMGKVLCLPEATANQTR